MNLHKNPSGGSCTALYRQMDITRLGVLTMYFTNAPKSEFKRNSLWSELDQDRTKWQVVSLGGDTTTFTNELHKKVIASTAFSKIFGRLCREDAVRNNE